MRALKISMWLVLICWFFWLGVLLAGPSLLMRYVDIASEGNLKLIDPVVTPDLQVKAKKLEFYDRGQRSGYLSGLDAEWSLFTFGSPVLNVSAASGAFDENTKLEKISVNISIGENENTLKVLASVAAVHTTLFGSSFKDISLQAFLSQSMDRIDNLRFRASELNTLVLSQVSAESVSGNIDSLSLKNSGPNFDLKGTIDFTGVQSGDLFKIPSINIAYQKHNQELVLDFTIPEASADLYQTWLKGGSGRATLDLENFQLKDEMEFSLKEINLDSRIVHSVDALIAITGATISARGNGAIAAFDLILNDKYIGHLPDLDFDFDLRSKLVEERVGFDAQANFLNDRLPLKFSVLGSGNFEHDVSATRCINQRCRIADVMASYEFAINGSMAEGYSSCTYSSCRDGGFQHTIKIRETNDFFGKIQATNILSPIVLGFLYSQVLAGEKVDSGHTINF